MMTNKRLIQKMQKRKQVTRTKNIVILQMKTSRKVAKAKSGCGVGEVRVKKD